MFIIYQQGEKERGKKGEGRRAAKGSSPETPRRPLYFLAFARGKGKEDES